MPELPLPRSIQLWTKRVLSSVQIQGSKSMSSIINLFISQTRHGSFVLSTNCTINHAYKQLLHNEIWRISYGIRKGMKPARNWLKIIFASVNILVSNCKHTCFLKSWPLNNASLTYLSPRWYQTLSVALPFLKGAVPHAQYSQKPHCLSYKRTAVK